MIRFREKRQIKTVQQFIEQDKKIDSKGNFIGFHTPVFKFSEEYLINKSYKEFNSLRRKKYFQNIKEKYNSFELIFKYIWSFVSRRYLKFNKDSYEDKASRVIIHNLIFIIEEMAKNKKNLSLLTRLEHSFNSKRTHLIYAERDFLNDLVYIDKESFYIIQTYFRAYFEWAKTENITNSRLRLQKKVEAF